MASSPPLSSSGTARSRCRPDPVWASSSTKSWSSAYGSRSGSAKGVGLQVFEVELPAEPRPVGQLDHPVHEGRPIPDEVSPDRVAVGVEALHVGAVRHGGEQMGGN